MDFVVHKQEDRLLDLEFTGESRTVLQLLKERILEDDKVETSTVIQDHPVLDEPRLVVRTGEGRRPETALKNTAKDLREDFDNFEDELIEELE
jgi:DNA-directed RNA polymerase subunit L